MEAAPVEVARRWFDALAQGDPAPDLCDPEIEIRNWDEAPITGPYHGHEGLQQWWDDVADAFEDVRFELLALGRDRDRPRRQDPERDGLRDPWSR